MNPQAREGLDQPRHVLVRLVVAGEEEVTARRARALGAEDLVVDAVRRDGDLRGPQLRRHLPRHGLAHRQHLSRAADGPPQHRAGVERREWIAVWLVQVDQVVNGDDHGNARDGDDVVRRMKEIEPGALGGASDHDQLAQ